MSTFWGTFLSNLLKSNFFENFFEYFFEQILFEHFFEYFFEYFFELFFEPLEPMKPYSNLVNKETPNAHMLTHNEDKPHLCLQLTSLLMLYEALTIWNHMCIVMEIKYKMN